MGWGSAFANAYSAASTAAKSMVQQAAQSSKAAWNYTQQSVDKVIAGIDAASNAAAQKADTAGNWAAQQAQVASEKVDAAKQWAGEVNASASKAVGEAFDKVANSFRAQTAGAPKKDCPLAKAEQELPPPPRGNGSCQPPPSCFFKPLSVKCGHGARGFLLIPPNTPTNPEFQQVIQVIADDNGSDTITVDFSAGSCSKGCGPNLPSLKFGDFESRSALTIKVQPPPLPNLVPLLPLFDFFTHFVCQDGNGAFRSYAGSVLCGEAGGRQNFEVQAFPKRKWHGKLSARFEIPRNEGPNAPRSGLEYSRSRAQLAISGELTGEYGIRKVTVKPPSIEISEWHARPIVGTEQGFGATKKFLEKVYPSIKKFRESRYVTIEPMWPDVSFSGGMEAAEVKGRYNVSWKGDVALQLSPLFGLQGTFDALQWLIDVACYAYLSPAVGPIVADQIKYLREKAEEGYSSKSGKLAARAVAKLDIIAGGSVGGRLQWQFLPEQKDKASGAITGDLDIKVVGEISGEVRYWKVGYQAGATISGESGVAAELSANFYGDDPVLAGKVTFKGLTIKAVAFYGAGGSSIGTKADGKAAVADRKAAKKKGRAAGGWFSSLSWSDAEVKEESDWEMKIIEEASWPSDDLPSGGLGGGKGFDGGGASGSFTPLQSGM